MASVCTPGIGRNPRGSLGVHGPDRGGRIGHRPEPRAGAHQHVFQPADQPAARGMTQHGWPKSRAWLILLNLAVRPCACWSEQLVSCVQIMAFTDFPFEPALMRKRSRDSRRFCGHAEVCYLPRGRPCNVEASCLLVDTQNARHSLRITSPPGWSHNDEPQP